MKKEIDLIINITKMVNMLDDFWHIDDLFLHLGSHGEVRLHFHFLKYITRTTGKVLRLGGNQPCFFHDITVFEPKKVILQ